MAEQPGFKGYTFLPHCIFVLITYSIVVYTSTTPTNINYWKYGFQISDNQTNCTPPGIEEFPKDLFTQTQRRHGWVALHVIACIFIFYALDLVCDDYFVPSIEKLCDGTSVPKDVIAASIMAMGTSSQELFTNIVGTFVTKGDLGIGTVVGSAVFNLLGVAGICGLGASAAMQLDWYPLTRDTLFYSIAILLLLGTMYDRRVYWYEALVLVGAYVFYLVALYFNDALKKFFEKVCYCCQANAPTLAIAEEEGANEGTWSEQGTIDCSDREELLEDEREEYHSRRESENSSTNSDEDAGAQPFDPPLAKRWYYILWWVTSWPIQLIMWATIPNCKAPRWSGGKWYLLTFASSVVWIAILSYLVSWMMTIIGYTIGVPDSVMGLTALAMGNSVPEAVSSYIVAKRGMATMSLANSIGSNTFDILICLGLPWLIRATIVGRDAHAEKDYIQVYSGGLEISSCSLLGILVFLYVILWVNGFRLDRKIGVLSIAVYCIFLVMASLVELNVFFPINKPPCPWGFHSPLK